MFDWLYSVDSILAGLNRLVSRLEKVAQRNYARSEKFTKQAELAKFRSEAAFSEADRAEQVIANIRKLVAKP